MDSLLEEDRAESRVESTNALALQDLGEATNQTTGKAGSGNETDTGGLKRAEGHGGEELGAGSRDGVDEATVLAGRVDTEDIDGLLLEELVTSELEATLDEITGDGRAEAGQESTSTLILDDLAESSDGTTVVGSRVQLDLSLDPTVQEVSQRDYLTVEKD
jgi:hypothetical protein